MHDQIPDDLAEALDEVMSDSGRFGHRHHLHLAWLAIRHGESNAETTLARWLRTIAESHGNPDRFHATLTAVWIKLVRHHLESDSGEGGFGGFLARNPGLLDSSLVEHHYQKGTLQTIAARRSWVPPDRLALPA